MHQQSEISAAGFSVDQHYSDEYYLHERYKQTGKKKFLLKAYYALRPLVPRFLQIAMRRKYAKRQAQVEFPRWPIEPVLIERYHERMKSRVEQSPERRIPLIGFWPDGYSAAAILTHDVEWNDPGVLNIPRVRELERKYGVVSSWNFVAERYKFDKKIFDDLRTEGCEIGLHGLYHDGKKFSSRVIFEERLPKMNAYIKDWDVVGFRSPATHRNPEWMGEIEVEYDSSFPDTDPFEPQSGGCCSILPFFLGNVVELPITLVQDHTLIEILQEKDIGLWKQKSEWIIENNGLINIIIHPDYMISDRNLWYYEEFLKYITGKRNVWLALPRDAAQWWRDRTTSEIIEHDSGVVIKGPASKRGRVLWISVENGNLKYSYERTAHTHQYNGKT